MLTRLIALYLAAGILAAQDFRATLTGRVTDPSGAPVPSAAVTPRNIDTNVTYASKTDSHGNYTSPRLPPGNYSVNVPAPGFKQSVRSNVALTVAETTTVNFILE